MRAWPTLIFLLAAIPARADPMALIVNMNYADGNYCSPEELAAGCVPKPGELASLEKVAASRGVKKADMLIVPPPAAVPEFARISAAKTQVLNALKALDPGNAEIVTQLQAIQDKGPAGLTDPKIIAKLSSPGATPAEQKAIQALSAAKLASLQKSYADFFAGETKAGPIDQQMNAAMKLVHQRKGSLEMLSVSGHSTGNEIFSETSYKLFPAQLRALIKAYPEVVKAPARIFLPGCYTYTRQEFERWRDDIHARPDALIVGYDDPGFSRRQPEEWGYIEQVNELANKLDAETRAGEKVYVSDIRKGLYALPALRGYKGAAISYCSQYINYDADGKEAMDCGNQWETLEEKSNDAVERYLAYDKVPEEDPPADTAKSPLRSFYSLWKRICSPKSLYTKVSDADLVQQMNEERDGYSNRALRTIFWREVQSNFVRCQAADVAKVRAELAKAGLPALPLDGAAGRRDFIAAYLALQQKLAALPPAKDPALREALPALTPLVELSNSIPAQWVEPGSACQ